MTAEIGHYALVLALALALSVYLAVAGACYAAWRTGRPGWDAALFAALPADGVAVLNADDEFAPLWRDMTVARVVTFGLRDFHQLLKAKFGLADR